MCEAQGWQFSTSLKNKLKKSLLRGIPPSFLTNQQINQTPFFSPYRRGSTSGKELVLKSIGRINGVFQFSKNRNFHISISNNKKLGVKN